MLTSIQIRNDVKETLHSMKKKGESYEDVIRRLIEINNKPKQTEPSEIKNNNKRTLKPVRLIG